MAGDLAGKVAVITGGATGIGRAVAAQLSSQGVRVVLAGRNTERGNSAAQALAEGGQEVKYIRTDVTRESDVQALVQQAVDTYGGIDYLFNNAGVEGALGPMDANTETGVDEVLTTNVKGVFLCMKHAIPRMAERGGGIVINTASFVGTTVPFPDGVLYGATKAAVLSMTRSVAAGCAEQNVRVFAVCPWITDTPMVDRLTGHQAEAKAQFGGINPSGRIATPQDIAGVVLSIFRDGANLESGDAVLVDSGGTTQKIRPMSV